MNGLFGVSFWEGLVYFIRLNLPEECMSTSTS